MSKLARNLLIAGLFLAIGCPVIGIAVTVCFMMLSFHDLGQNGITNPQQLSGHIGGSLIAEAAGFMAILPGLALIAASLILICRGRSNPKPLGGCVPAPDAGRVEHPPR